MTCQPQWTAAPTMENLRPATLIRARHPTGRVSCGAVWPKSTVAVGEDFCPMPRRKHFLASTHAELAPTFGRQQGFRFVRHPGSATLTARMRRRTRRMRSRHFMWRASRRLTWAALGAQHAVAASDHCGHAGETNPHRRPVPATCSCGMRCRRAIATNGWPTWCGACWQAGLLRVPMSSCRPQPCRR